MEKGNAGRTGSAPTKGREGFRYHVRQAAGLGSSTVRDLMLDKRFVGAVLKFLKNTKVWEVLNGGRYAFRLLFLLPPPFFLPSLFTFCVYGVGWDVLWSAGRRRDSFCFFLSLCCHKSENGAPLPDLSARTYMVAHDGRSLHSPNITR